MTVPCPYCGGRPQVDYDLIREVYSVLCPRCHCFGPVSDSEKGALAAWDDMAGRLRA